MRLGHWVSLVVLASGLAASPACNGDDDPGTAGGSAGEGGSGTPGRGGAMGDAAGGARAGGSGGTAGTTGGKAGGAGTGGGGGATGGTGGKGGTGGTGGSRPDAGTDVGTPDAGQLTEGQVVGVLHAANMGEIQMSTLADARSANTEVRAFAANMIQEHTAADNALLALAADAGPALAPAESPASLMLTMRAVEEVQVLQPLTGTQFDLSYMTAQLEAHAQVLSLINDLLLPSSMHPALRTQVMMMRDAVSMHLATAQQILQRLGMDAGMDAGDAGGGADASDAADASTDASADAADGASDARSDVSDGGRDGDGG